MSTAASSFSNAPGNRVRVDAPRWVAKVVAALEAQQPQTRGELIERTGGLEIEINLALDRAMTDGQIERKIIAGRISYHLPDWQPATPARSKPSPLPSTAEVLPAAAATPAPVSAQPAVVAAAEPLAAPAPSAVVVASVRDRVLSYVAKHASADGCTSAIVASGIAHELEATKAAMKQLRDKGLLRLQGRKRSARWFITPAGQQRLGTESIPGVTTPAVQPIDTASSTAVLAARQTLTAVTEPAGSRDEPSFSISGHDFEPAGDELLAWHAQRAESEAARRQSALAGPAPAFADLNELFEMPAAMRNTGEDVDAGVATSVLIDSARFALWSDGRLEIDAGSDHVTLSPPAARALLDYLDRVCAIDPH